jgi:hypothetical protein
MTNSPPIQGVVTRVNQNVPSAAENVRRRRQRQRASIPASSAITARASGLPPNGRAGWPLGGLLARIAQRNAAGRPYVQLSRPRPYMGPSDRRVVLSACSFAISSVATRIVQTQTRSRERSRLAWQYRLAIASWEAPICPHAPHACTVVPQSTGSGPSDWTSHSVVMN